MSLVLNVEILGEFKNLTAATKGAQTSLSSLNKATASISRKMTGALAAIGLGFSLRTVINELEESAKAAVEDSKSQQILALAMENTGMASAKNVQQAESFIASMQTTAAVADDKLRPAYQKLFIATGDVTESNRLLKIALDASAATGKDLDTISQAMAKSLAGSDTALNKLIPSLKGSKTPIDDMAAAFAGAAEQAANTDPYARISVIFQDIQEQIGMQLLPVLNDFSTWLATPEGQEKMQQLVDLAKDVIANFSAMAKWVLDNKDWLVPMVAAIGTVTSAWKIATGAVEAYNAAAAIIGAIGAGAAGVLGGAAAGAALGGYQQGQITGQTSQIYAGALGIGKPTPTQNVTINVKSTQSAQDIAAVLARSTKTNGVTVFRGL
jgi:hypothetical protein